MQTSQVMRGDFSTSDSAKWCSIKINVTVFQGTRTINQQIAKNIQHQDGRTQVI